MQQLALFMIVAVTIVPYLTLGDAFNRFAILPGPAKYLPDLLGVAALVCVLAIGVRERFRFVRPAYWIVFGFLTLCLAASAAANALEPGPLFSGIRAYFRAIPWFFLPAVFAFTEKHVRTQLRWLLALSLLQVPLAIDQRLQTANNYFGEDTNFSGDYTTGTLMDSGFLSIFLVATACVIVALAIRRSIPKWQGVILFLAVLVPTMINETKATLVLVPIGLALTLQAAARRGERLKQTLLALGVFAVFLALFVPTYNWLMADAKYGYTVGEFFSGGKESGGTESIESYLDRGGDINNRKTVGRVDTTRVAIRETLQDPVRAVLGLGIGNTMDSALGPQFYGAYFERYKRFTGTTSFAGLLLELGFVGFGLLMAVYWLILRDAWWVAERGSPFKSALAAAWVGITLFMALALFYTTVQISVALSCLFFYFSGLLASERMRLAVETVGSAERVAAPSGSALRTGRRAHA